MIQLNHLRYFHAVDKMRSIRRAAESLNVAQSAVSRQVQNLELEFGMALIDRHSRGVRLTDAGVILAKYAHQSLLNLERVRSEIDDLKALRSGKINICTVEAGIADIIPHVIIEFKRLYPAVRSTVQVMGTYGVIDTLLRDDADIGLTFNTPPDPEIEIVASQEQCLYAVVAPSHEIAGRSVIRIEDLQGLPIALPDTSFGIRHLIDDMQRELNLRIEPVLLTNSIQALVKFAIADIGVTFLPYFAAKSEIDAGKLVAVPLANRLARNASVDIIRHRRRQLPVAAVEMLKHLTEALTMLRRPKS